MKVDPELSARTRDRLVGRAGELRIKPITLFQRAMGYHNKTTWAWLSGDAVLRNGTLVRINAFLDEEAASAR